MYLIGQEIEKQLLVMGLTVNSSKDSNKGSSTASGKQNVTTYLDKANQPRK